MSPRPRPDITEAITPELVLRQRLVLRVWAINPGLDGRDTIHGEFDEPELLARASEGFCPFSNHWGKDDECAVKLVPHDDGTVTCGEVRGGVHMRFEWLTERVFIP